MTRHPKLQKPSNKDLNTNPMIGGSKGAAIAQVSAGEMEDLQGANTIEGDVENDLNAAGGINKSVNRTDGGRR